MVALALQQEVHGPWGPDDYGSDRLGDLFYSRAEGSGLRPLSSVRPWFPRNFRSPEVIGGSAGYHWCDGGSRRLMLPSVLVLPVRFWDAYSRCYQRPQITFQPYYTSHVLVDHIGMTPPDSRFMRDVTVFEALAILLAFPGLGSIRAWDPAWHQPSVQVYFDEAKGALVGNCHGSDSGHHRAFVDRIEGRSHRLEEDGCVA